MMRMVVNVPDELRNRIWQLAEARGCSPSEMAAELLAASAGDRVRMSVGMPDAVHDWLVWLGARRAESASDAACWALRRARELRVPVRMRPWGVETRPKTLYIDRDLSEWIDRERGNMSKSKFAAGMLAAIGGVGF